MKVYDCFTFYNEFDQLKIRLALLTDIVEKFIIIEATSTHSGKPKKLYIKDGGNDEILSNPKVVCVSIDLPEHMTNWEREQYQREYIKIALEREGVNKGDFVMISDVDEIPTTTAIIQAIEQISKSKKKNKTVIAFEQRIFNFRLNYELLISNELPWLGTCASIYSENFSPNWIRASGRNISGEQGKSNDRTAEVRRIKNAGAHFSYLGNDSQITNKLLAFAHQEKEIQSSVGSSVEMLIENRIGLFRQRMSKEVWAIINPMEIGIPLDLIEKLEMEHLLVKGVDNLNDVVERIRNRYSKKKIRLKRFWIDFGIL